MSDADGDELLDDEVGATGEPALKELGASSGTGRSGTFWFMLSEAIFRRWRKD